MLHLIVQVRQEFRVSQVCLHVAVVAMVTRRAYIPLQKGAIHVEYWKALEQIFKLTPSHLYQTLVITVVLVLHSVVWSSNRHKVSYWVFGIARFNDVSSYK